MFGETRCNVEYPKSPWETCCELFDHEGDHVVYTDHDHTGESGVRLRWPGRSSAAPLELPAKGSRVRVILEGDVLFSTDEPRSFGIGVEGKNGDKNRIFPDKVHVVSVEVLSSPKPEFLVDDVILYKEVVYSRLYNGKWVGLGDNFEYDFKHIAVENHTLLVRDGEPPYQNG